MGRSNGLTWIGSEESVGSPLLTTEPMGIPYGCLSVWMVLTNLGNGRPRSGAESAQPTVVTPLPLLLRESTPRSLLSDKLLWIMNIPGAGLRPGLAYWRSRN
jgi:hypothetical protein